MRRARQAFTLVELLVVIAIIALLIAILLPVMKKAKEAANVVVCASQQRQIMQGVMMYTQENKGFMPIPPSIGHYYGYVYPLMYYMDSDPKYGGAGMIRYDVGSLWPYLAPGVNKIAGNATRPAPAVLERIMNCPSEPREARTIFWGGNFGYERNFSYSWNVQIRPDPPTQVPSCARMTKIKGSSHKALLIEEMAPNDGVCWVQYDLHDKDDVPTARHNGRANFGFADGHVSAIDRTEMGWEKKTGSESFGQSPAVIDPNKNAYYFLLNVEQ